MKLFAIAHATFFDTWFGHKNNKEYSMNIFFVSEIYIVWAIWNSSMELSSLTTYIVDISDLNYYTKSCRE